MTVQQTSQLIQLILNAALMLGVCVLLWGGLWLRHTALADRLKTLHLDYIRLFHTLPVDEHKRDCRDRLQTLRRQQRYLQYHCRMAKRCALVLHYALLGFIFSIFALAARCLFYLDWLVPVSMVVFTAGTALLLLCVGLALMDIQRFQVQSSVRRASGFSLFSARILKWGRTRRPSRSLPRNRPRALAPADYPSPAGVGLTTLRALDKSP
ncbi:MAG: hypothetical protein AAGF66_20950 [Cyanobacteria bacterium P01_H01_bin.119]